MSQPQQSNAVALRERREALVASIADKAIAVAQATIDPAKFHNMVLALLAKTAHLDECSPASIALCLQTCTRLDLMPGDPRNYVAFVPRNSRKPRIGPNGEKVRDDRGKEIWDDHYECTLIIQYQGLLKLARRERGIVSVDARVVYVGEHVEVIGGGAELVVRHHIDPLLDRTGITPDNAARRIVGAYAVVELGTGAIVREFLTIGQIEDRRRRGASGGTKRDGSGRISTPWETDYAAMARKSALRALLLGGAVPLDEGAVAGIRDGDEPESVVIEGEPEPAARPARRAAPVWEPMEIEEREPDVEEMPAEREPVQTAPAEERPKPVRKAKAPEPEPDDDALPT